MLIQDLNLIRNQLATQFIQWHKSTGNTQHKTAELIGITQPRMSNLTKMRLEKFSVDTLIEYFHRAGLKVVFTIELQETEEVVDNAANVE